MNLKKKIVTGLAATAVAVGTLGIGAAPAQAAGYTGNCYQTKTYDRTWWRTTVTTYTYCEYVTSLGMKVWVRV